MKRYVTLDPRFEPNMITCPRCQGDEKKYCSYCENVGRVPEGADIEVEHEDYDKYDLGNED